MYVRVVRFTDVNEERIAGVADRVRDSGGPPPGVEASGIRLLFDADSGTAVVLQEFPTAEAMEAAARIFDAMDTGETPGVRSSVDACEVRLDLSA